MLGIDEPHVAAHEPQERQALRYYLAVATRPGVRGLLLAEWLWVMGYAALPAFFILYAEKVLDLSLARASLVLAAFGLVTAVAMFAAGRVKRPELLRPCSWEASRSWVEASSPFHSPRTFSPPHRR